MGLICYCRSIGCEEAHCGCPFCHASDDAQPQAHLVEIVAGLEFIRARCALTRSEEAQVIQLMCEGRNVPPPAVVIDRWRDIHSTASELLRRLQ